MLVLAIILAVSCVVSLIASLFTIRGALSLKSLPEMPFEAPARWPKLSLIVPACNEAETIESALRSKCAADYPNLEIVAIDDRSTDGTGAIIQRVAGENSLVKAVRVDELPAGWLGKLHAMDTGLLASDGEWVLFSDADVHLAPGTLRHAIAHCEARGLDHLTVVPDMWPSGFVLDAVISTFLRLLLLTGRLWAVEDPRSTAAAGAGAFNLVRRSALEKIGGLSQIRMDVADDMALGLVLKQSGARPAVLAARGAVGLYFYRSLKELAHGVEKNGFAVVARFSYLRLVLAVIAFFLLELGPLAAFLVPHGLTWLHVLGAASTGVALATSAGLCVSGGRRILPALCGALATVILAVFFIRSAVLATRRGGIAWRGTLYSIDELKRGSKFKPL